MTSSSPITVLLAEDHKVVRQGLRMLLDSESDIRIVGEATNGRQAVDMAVDLRPSVVVLDIAMPVLNGLEAARQIHEAAPESKVLILSAHSDDAYVESVTASGASGYLVKQASAQDLVEAIRDVHQGRTHFSPAIARRHRRLHPKRIDRNGKVSDEGPHLTHREVEVFQRIAEGEANKQIADGLDISIKTVEKHRASLMKKLDLHNTAALTRHAIATGIIESSVQLTIE